MAFAKAVDVAQPKAMSLTDQLLYAAAWLAFGALHSLTAGASVRSGLGCLFGRAHRLAYNALAALQLALVLALGYGLGAGAPGYARPFGLELVQGAMLAGGAVLGLVALRGYRAGAFLGWAQLRGEEDGDQPLVLDGLHRWMRHPLYSAALLLVWGLVRDDLSLATALWVSAYFTIGSVFEERRLMARYGERYRRYCTQVPRFVPRIGRSRP